MIMVMAIPAVIFAHVTYNRDNGSASAIIIKEKKTGKIHRERTKNRMYFNSTGISTLQHRPNLQRHHSGCISYH